MRNITVSIMFLIAGLFGLAAIRCRAKKHNIDAEQWLMIWITSFCVGGGIAYLLNDAQMALSSLAFVWSFYHMSEKIRHKEKIKWRVK